MAGSEWMKPAALAKREGVSRATIWAWVEKDLVDVKRLAGKTHVRVRLRNAEEVALRTGRYHQNAYGEVILDP
jgi:hypothetical protein